jgi:hypothetical protein
MYWRKTYYRDEAASPSFCACTALSCCLARLLYMALDRAASTAFQTSSPNSSSNTGRLLSISCRIDSSPLLKADAAKARRPMESGTISSKPCVRDEVEDGTSSAGEVAEAQSKAVK